MNEIKIIDNFLTQEEVDIFLSFAKNTDKWHVFHDQEFWNQRTLNAEFIYKNLNKEVGLLLYNVRQRVKTKAEELYPNDSPIYPDMFQIVKWPEGYEQDPHHDDMKGYAGTDWFHHRKYGSVLYLNDDYEGGKTYYPQHNISITPKSGSLVIHPGDIGYVHGVTEVKNNTRYTLAGFWTYEKEYFDGWTIH